MHNKLAKYSLVSPKKLGHYAENDKMTVENTAEVSFMVLAYARHRLFIEKSTILWKKKKRIAKKKKKRIAKKTKIKKSPDFNMRHYASSNTSGQKKGP